MAGTPRILFAGGGTGGHLYPALALATAFEQRPGGAEIYFLGAERGVEAQVLPQRGVRHSLLAFEPIRRSRAWENWRLAPSLVRVAGGIRQVFRDFRPDLVVGTGGYASGPVVAWAIMSGVPSAIQEQNSFPGLVTRWLAPRVRQLHLAFPEALRYLKPGSRTEVFELGNPIQPPDLSLDRGVARRRFGLGDGVVLLVTGGSQGAKSVNEALLRDLSGQALDADGGSSSQGIQILWATGPKNYEAVAAAVAGMGVGEWVRIEPYITEMPMALAAADIAIARAGAMSIAELCAWGIPSILVPFPHAAANHQYHNARALAEAGAAVMLEESELTAGRLWGEVVALVRDDERRVEMASRARERGHPEAAREIVEHLSALLPD